MLPNGKVALYRDLRSYKAMERCDPPFLMLQGDADPVVPWHQSEKLYEKLCALGYEAELVQDPKAEEPSQQTLHLDTEE